MSRVYLDTEFEGLYKDAKLISMGLVSDDGKELYLEFNDIDTNKQDEWIKQNVLGNTVYYGNKNIENITDEMNYFVGDNDLPKNVNASCHDINQDIARYYYVTENVAFNMSREDILKDSDINIDGEKHNSLYDAKVIRELYKILNSGLF